MTTAGRSSRGRSERVGLLLAGLVSAATVFAGTRAALRSAEGLRATWPREVDTLMVPPAALLDVLSFGHREMAADLVAARANVYFGSQLATHGEQRFLATALETALDLDPRFHRLYQRGAAMLVYNGRDFSVEALLAANHLLGRGRREFPGDWELPFQMGFNLLFELPRLAGEDDPRVPDWRQRGVESLREAALLDGAPTWLPSLSARMLTKQGGEELAIRHLEQTYAATSNPQTRAEIARRLAELRGRRLTEELAAGAAAFEALTRQYPYAPEAFSLVVGPRMTPDLDSGLGRAHGVDLGTGLGKDTDPSAPPPSAPPAAREYTMPKNSMSSTGKPTP